MNRYKEIILDIQAKLSSDVPELLYIDKDWGQLNYEIPAVKYPCALLDISQTSFRQLGNGAQQADCDFVITIANLRLTPSSVVAPNKEDSFKMIDLIEKIHSALQMYASGKDYSPLFRSGLRKIQADSTAEIYELIYSTAFVCR